MPRRVSDQLRQGPPVVLPSLLLCDFGRLAHEVRSVEAAGARALHRDIMDGNFVPNITYGAPIVEAVNRATDLPLDVHMMIARPADYIDEFVAAGADIITIHAEAIDDPRPVLQQSRQCGAAASLAVNPPTPLEKIAGCLPYCDQVLCMSVMPGFGGQKFDPAALDKLRELKAQYGDKLLLEVDGGVNEQTIAECVRAGADMLVVGAAIFRNERATYQESLANLNLLAQTQ
jgi:ribulose-phosphate 3-epimerase